MPPLTLNRLIRDIIDLAEVCSHNIKETNLKKRSIRIKEEFHTHQYGPKKIKFR
jgi:hypothetical protein